MKTMPVEWRRFKTAQTSQAGHQPQPPAVSSNPLDRQPAQRTLGIVVPGQTFMLSTLSGGGTLCAMAALVLLVVATATDYWMQYRYSGNFANQGLWRFCINRKCHAHTLTVDFWDATRAFMLLSVLSAFVASLLGLGTLTSSTKSRRVRAGGVASLLAGFLSLLALSIYTGATLHFFGKRYINWTFSWSYIVGWIGIILALTAGILQLCAYRKKMSEPPPPSITSDS